MIMTENNIVSASFSGDWFSEKNSSMNCVKSWVYAMSSEYEYEFWWKTLKVWRLRTDEDLKNPIETDFMR